MKRKVAGKDHGLLLVLDVDRLVAGGVPTRHPHPDAGCHLAIAVDDQQASFLLEQAEVSVL